MGPPAVSKTQQGIIDKKLHFYVINAYEVAQKTGMGGRINTIMQTCFFAISGVLPREQAIDEIKKSHQEDLRKTRRSSRASRTIEAVDQYPGEPA